MKEIWTRIEKWIGDHSPPGTFSLEEGASEAEIAKAEATLGKLPSDVRASYRVHNGSNRIWLTESGYLMPLFVPSHLSQRKQRRFNSVVHRWTLMKELLDRGDFDGPGFRSEPIGAIKTDHWNPRWLPITDNQCGDHLCVDMAPPKGGKRGQIIQWEHEVGAVRVVAGSMSEWLRRIADDMEAGRYALDPKVGAVRKVGK